jgi:hypothetical protein
MHVTSRLALTSTEVLKYELNRSSTSVDTTVTPASTRALSSKASNGLLSPSSPYTEPVISSDGEGSVAAATSSKSVSESNTCLHGVLIGIAAKEENKEAEVICCQTYTHYFACFSHGSCRFLNEQV